MVCHAKTRWVSTKDGFNQLLNPARPYDVTIHLATSYGSYGGNLTDIVESNILLPVKVFETALKSGCRTIISTDTFSSHPRHNYAHMSDYQLSKRQMAQWGMMLAEMHPDLCYFNVRLEHVYGPGDTGRKFVPFLVDSLLREVPRIPLTKGEQQRDFIHVEDVCSAYIRLLGQGKPGFHEIGLGSGTAIPLRRFVQRCKEISKSGSQLDFGALELRQGEIMHSVADDSFLFELGWKPEVALDEGIENLIACRRDQVGGGPDYQRQF